MMDRINQWLMLIANAGVLAGIGFLAIEIQQNTAAIEAAEANNIWQAWRETVHLSVINNADFASVRAKAQSSQPFSDAEQIQWDSYMAAQIDIWAQLFDLQSNHLISQELWGYWDDGFMHAWGDHHERVWQRIRGAYNHDFQAHVDSSLRNDR